VLDERQLGDDVTLRLLRASDAAELAAAYVRNRAHLAPWEPVRPDEFYTEEWQAADIASRLAPSESGEVYPLALFEGATVVGRLTLSRIVRSSFQSAGLGYWIDGERTGRGLATAAVSEALAVARDELGLHRVEASTLLHNLASQRVLLKAGFQQIGMAPRYLQIAGAWQDHNLYQAILHD
jgi:ribosomal-protein-alanine N-acetyltransferase